MGAERDPRIPDSIVYYCLKILSSSPFLPEELPLLENKTGNYRISFSPRIVNSNVKMFILNVNSVQFSRSVVSNSLRSHELQHARPPCPSPTPRVHPNPCPLSRWCHPAISSCRPLLLLPPIPPSIRVFFNESSLHMRWPKYLMYVHLYLENTVKLIFK